MIAGRNKQLLPNHTGAVYYYDSMNVDGNAGVLSDFGAVQSLTDLTYNNHDLSQSNASIAPIYRTLTLHNQNTLTFNDEKIMTSTNIDYAGEVTLMALIECDVSFETTPGNIISYGNDGGVSFGTGLSDFTKLRLSCNGVGDFETTGSAIVNGQFAVVAAVLKNNSGTWSVDFYKNGIFIENVSALAPAASTDSFCLGCLDSSGSDGWLGQIVMVAGWHSNLSASKPIFDAMQELFITRGSLN